MGVLAVWQVDADIDTEWTALLGDLGRGAHELARRSELVRAAFTERGAGGNPTPRVRAD